VRLTLDFDGPPPLDRCAVSANERLADPNLRLRVAEKESRAHVLDRRRGLAERSPKRGIWIPGGHSSPVPASAATDRNMRPIEIIMACAAGRNSIGEWS